MSEKPREDEKLSFKEQILRDLEKVKQYEGIRQEAAELDEKKSALSVPDTKIADEEVMNASLSAVEKIMEKAPGVTQQKRHKQKRQDMNRSSKRNLLT